MTDHEKVVLGKLAFGGGDSLPGWFSSWPFDLADLHLQSVITGEGWAREMLVTTAASPYPFHISHSEMSDADKAQNIAW